MSKRPEPLRPGRQSGVTMIEVLVSLLLVAIGTLALAALQVSSKRSNLDARQRAVAAQAGYGFLERIRGNNSREGIDAYIVEAATNFGGALHGEDPPSPDCGAGVACTPTQMAAYDAWQFEQELDGAETQIGDDNAGGLRTPFACLASTVTGNNTQFTLTIVWRGSTALPDNAGVACAQDTGNYGDDDEFRRSVTLTAFVLTRT